MGFNPRDKELAQDPKTSLSELRRIVRDVIVLRPDVYANPSCPEEIRQWIRSESATEAEQGERIIQRRATELERQKAAEQRAQESTVSRAQRARERNSAKPSNILNSPSRPGQFNVDARVQPQTPKKKHGCLKFFLILVLLYFFLPPVLRFFGFLIESFSAYGVGEHISVLTTLPWA